MQPKKNKKKLSKNIDSILSHRGQILKKIFFGFAALPNVCV
jgi:hypothetical protein